MLLRLHPTVIDAIASTNVGLFKEVVDISPHRERRMSNNDLLAESLFKTCVYRPNWSNEGFKGIVAVRAWVLTFTRWYSDEYKHNQLNFVTPNQRHMAKDKETLERLKETMVAVKAANPIRWGSQKVRNCEPVGLTTLNPVEEQQQQRLQAA